MSNSKLLRIKNKQKTPYKRQKTASSYKILPLNGLMTVLGLMSNSEPDSFQTIQTIQNNCQVANCLYVKPI